MFIPQHIFVAQVHITHVIDKIILTKHRLVGPPRNRSGDYFNCKLMSLKDAVLTVSLEAIRSLSNSILITRCITLFVNFTVNKLSHW